MQHPSHGSPSEPLTPEQRAAIAATLHRVLASPAFRNSKQCQKFLQYVVEHRLAGEDDRLRERSIGVELFGRAPDYDTGEDPVVRVRATEVRKRLSQYYGDTELPDTVRFEMPSGSYRPEFTWQAAKPTDQPAPQPAPRRRWLAFVALVVGFAILLAVLAWKPWSHPAAPTALDQFWAPVLESQSPVLIYCGQPVVYFLSRDLHERFRDKLPAGQKRGSYVLELDPGANLKGRDIIPVTDQFIGIGNAHTSALLTGLFANRKKSVELRYANDVSFTDLRNSPAILIGGFSNFWTLEMTAKLRFVFEQDNGTRRVRDRTTNKTWLLPNLAPDGKTPEDYAVVSRLFDSGTGQLLISAAGITQYGTRVSGEFLTDPNRLAEALKQAPPNWAKLNLQVLLHTRVYNGTPGAPRVLATHFW